MWVNTIGLESSAPNRLNSRLNKCYIRFTNQNSNKILVWTLCPLCFAFFHFGQTNCLCQLWQNILAAYFGALDEFAPGTIVPMDTNKISGNPYFVCLLIWVLQNLRHYIFCRAITYAEVDAAIAHKCQYLFIKELHGFDKKSLKTKQCDQIQRNFAIFHHIKNLWLFKRVQIVFCQSFELTLANFKCYWANSHCWKWKK